MHTQSYPTDVYTLEKAVFFLKLLGSLWFRHSLGSEAAALCLSRREHHEKQQPHWAWTVRAGKPRQMGWPRHLQGMLLPLSPTGSKKEEKKGRLLPSRTQKPKFLVYFFNFWSLGKSRFTPHCIVLPLQLKMLKKNVKLDS